MFIQSGTAIRHNAQMIGGAGATRNVLLFADCPELIGASMSYGRDEEIYGEGRRIRIRLSRGHGFGAHLQASI